MSDEYDDDDDDDDDDDEHEHELERTTGCEFCFCSCQSKPISDQTFLKQRKLDLYSARTQSKTKPLEAESQGSSEDFEHLFRLHIFFLIKV